MPSIKALINKLERLNETHNRLQEEWKLCNEKVKRLRLALGVEAGTANKFQLEQQLQSESAQLKNLDQNIQNIETEIEQANRELVQAQSQLDESPSSPIQSSQSPSAQSLTQPIELEEPEGQVPLKSPSYVERSPIETDCYAAIVKPGALIRVKAARQMGKTSLMTRILHHAKQQGYRVVPIYFQEADGDVFTNLDQFLQWFCATITEELNLPDRVTELWQRGSLGSKRKCTNYFQQYLLSELIEPLVLGLDEADLVFQYLKIAQDFFPLLRTWHERGKNQLVWQKLRLVIVHSKEVYIPLAIHQSPFNVGVPIELPELTELQVQGLAHQHSLNWQVDQIEQLMAMVGGHPYLLRVALYEIARGRVTLANFLQIAPTEEGMYSDHLRRHLGNLKGNRDLANAMKQVIAANTPVQIDPGLSFQLHSMGLVKLKGNTVVTLCKLYSDYFRNRL